MYHSFLLKHFHKLEELSVNFPKFLSLTHSLPLPLPLPPSLSLTLSPSSLALSLTHSPTNHLSSLSVSLCHAERQNLGPGTLLTPGFDDDLIVDISKEFFDYERLEALAAQLLEGVGKGGHVFLMRHTVRGGVPDPVPLTRKVLHEWIQEKPSAATRGALYEVLRKVNPAAAHTFRSKLLGDPGERSS